MIVSLEFVILFFLTQLGDTHISRTLTPIEANRHYSYTLKRLGNFQLTAFVTILSSFRFTSNYCNLHYPVSTRVTHANSIQIVSNSQPFARYIKYSRVNRLMEKEYIIDQPMTDFSSSHKNETHE